MNHYLDKNEVELLKSRLITLDKLHAEMHLESIRCLGCALCDTLRCQAIKDNQERRDSLERNNQQVIKAMMDFIVLSSESGLLLPNDDADRALNLLVCSYVAYAKTVEESTGENLDQVTRVLFNYALEEREDAVHFLNQFLSDLWKGIKTVH